MQYMTTKEANKRENILFGRNYDKDAYRFGGIARFDDASSDAIRKLVDEGLADPGETQNNSPTIEEFIQFIESQDDPENWYLHGYAVSPERDDVRVAVEGIGSYSKVEPEVMADFALLCRFADDLEMSSDHVYCWYD